MTEQEIMSALDQAKTRRAEFTSLRSTGIIDRAYAIENCKHFSEQPHFVTVPLFNGALFQIDLREFVSQEIYLYGSFEEDLTAFFVKYLKPGMVFVDVGAHFGYYSVVASSLVGATGRVVAFEPVLTTFKRLQANTRNCTNVDVRQIAVWNKSGQLVINDFGNAWSAWNSVTAPRSEPGEMAKVRSENVAAITLEEAFPVSEPQPSVVKIDVESAEMEVLEGMSRLLREVRPVVTIEVGDKPHLRDAGVATSTTLLQNISEYGYDLHESIAGVLSPHVIKEHGAYKYDNIIAIPIDNKTLS